MSTNCIQCLKNKRTDTDLLCDECRQKNQQGKSLTSEINRQQYIEGALRDLAGVLNHIINTLFGQMGFVFIVFDFGQPGISNYISNAQRSDMIKALRETADRLEKRQDIPPAGTTIQ